MRREEDLVTEAQLPLAASVQMIHRRNGERLRTLFVRAMELNRFSRAQLSFETGKDLSHIGRMLDANGGAHPSPDVVACILAHDQEGVIPSGICAMCGREAVKVEPDPRVENKRLREQLHALRDELDRLLGGIQ